MGNIKEIEIKHQIYHFFNDMIRIKDLNPYLLKVDKGSYKNVYIYYIEYITIKDIDYVNINSLNILYYIINKANGYIAESIESKYLALVSNDKAKEVLAKYTELWDKIKNQIKKYMIKQVNMEKTP